jgi:hypothetical protein
MILTTRPMDGLLACRTGWIYKMGGLANIGLDIIRGSRRIALGGIGLDWIW